MIYLVEDDESIRELVVYTLNSQGLEAEGFGLPSEFWKAMGEKMPSLLLLDVMLPEEDGLGILQKIRKNAVTEKLPVMMLTAKGSEYDVVTGLDQGADDYVCKPFRMMEFLSRVKALLRRNQTEKGEIEYRAGELYVCPARHIVKAGDENITLTLKEFELLCCLFKEQGVVLTRSRILDTIWGYEFDGESRTVDVHIRTLRQKLGSAGNCIETVRGIGYKIGGRTF